MSAGRELAEKYLKIANLQADTALKEIQSRFEPWKLVVSAPMLAMARLVTCQLCVLVFVGCVLAFASLRSTKANEVDHYQLALAAVTAMNGGPAAMNSVKLHDMFISRMTQAGHAPPVDAEKSFTELRPTIEANNQTIAEATAKIFAQHFTSEELIDIARFWTSPTGRKVVNSQVVINQELATTTGLVQRNFFAHLWASADAIEAQRRNSLDKPQ